MTASPTTDRTPDGASARRPRITPGVAFWVVAWAFLISMAFNTVPTPLYAIYQQRDGFATWVITVIFAAYAVGVVVSLYLAGHVSDWLGRRPVVLAALLLEALSAVVFLAWPDVPGLVVARFVGGVGVGVLTATATAYLVELHGVARPGADQRRAGTVATAVNLGGLATGPLVSGVLAQYVRSPLAVPYAIFLVLLVTAAAAVALVPETVEVPGVRPAYRPQRVSLPGAARATFLAASIGAAASFSVMGLFMAVSPTVLAGTLGVTSRLAAGLVAFAVLGAAAASQLVLGALAPRSQLRTGIAAMPAGLAAIAVSVVGEWTWLFVLGAVFAGIGIGLVFKAGATTAAGLAAPKARGEAMAAFFLFAYAGITVPVLAVGAALAIWNTVPVVVTFAAVMAVVVVASGLRVVRALR